MRTALALFCLARLPCSLPAGNLERLKYNYPGLVVDLGVGLWASPLPMDFDGDGRFDLGRCHTVNLQNVEARPRIVRGLTRRVGCSARVCRFRGADLYRPDLYTGTPIVAGMTPGGGQGHRTLSR